MAPEPWHNDDVLLAELREALRSAGTVDEDLLALGRGTFAWRDVDTDLALLTITHDTLVDPQPLVRDADTATARTLTLEADGVIVVIEVSETGLLGQVVPPAPYEVALETRDGVQARTSADEVGFFSTESTPRGLLRLRLIRDDKPAAVSEWIRTD